MSRSSLPLTSEPESMEQLRGDCARMAPHWGVHDTAPTAAPSVTAPAPSVPRIAPISPVPEREAPRVLPVPPAYARLLEGMSEYGN
jgi:hypothetical protein